MGQYDEVLRIVSGEDCDENITNFKGYNICFAE